MGDLHFKAHTFPEADRGRWLTMVAGDIDGDGDADLVLGSFAQFNPNDDKTANARRHQPGAPTILILENTAKKRVSPRRE